MVSRQLMGDQISYFDYSSVIVRVGQRFACIASI